MTGRAYWNKKRIVAYAFKTITIITSLKREYGIYYFFNFIFSFFDFIFSYFFVLWAVR